MHCTIPYMILSVCCEEEARLYTFLLSLILKFVNLNWFCNQH
jgi:hypothetical protein